MDLKKEILSKYIETPFRHTKIVSEENALLAMEEFAEAIVNDALGYIDSDEGNFAANLVIQERIRQIKAEGYQPEGDEGHINEELPKAAASYLIAKDKRIMDEKKSESEAIKRSPPWFWPWKWKEWKPTPEDRLRELAKAGGLVLAEIERLKRLMDKNKEDGCQGNNS